MGSIISKDNKTWILPGENSFATGTKLFDLYNECVGKTPTTINVVDTAKPLSLLLIVMEKSLAVFYMAIIISNYM